jgi:hypothetical protein
MSRVGWDKVGWDKVGEGLSGYAAFKSKGNPVKEKNHNKPTNQDLY